MKNTTFAPIKVLNSLYMNAGPLSLTTLGIPIQANISFRNLIVEKFLMDVVLYTSNLIVQTSTAYPKNI